MNLSHLVHLTDRAIPQLGEISTLRQINFFATFNVTTSSRAKLQELLPNCAERAIDSGQSIFSLDTSFSGIDYRNNQDNVRAGKTANRVVGDFSFPSSMVPNMDKVIAHTILINKNEPTIRLRAGCTDKILESFDQLHKTNNLSMPQAEFTGVGFKHLVHLPLQMLDLQRSERFGNEGMQYVSKMHELHSLSLEKTNITDNDLANLPTSITDLSLSQTRITPAGLRSLTKLVTLNLGHLDRFTDRSLEQLASLKSLRKLKLVGARTITRGGLARFREINPTCELDTTVASQPFINFREPKLFAAPIERASEI